MPAGKCTPNHDQTIKRNYIFGIFYYYNNFFSITRKSSRQQHICIIWLCVPLSSLKIICSDRQGILRVFSIWKFPAKLPKLFVFLFIKLEPFVPFFPRFPKLPCSFDRSCSGHWRSGQSLRAVTRNTCYDWVASMLRVEMSIGITLHLHTEQNATGDNLNVTAAWKLNDSPEGVALISRSCFPPKKTSVTFKLVLVWTFQQIVFWKKIKMRPRSMNCYEANTKSRHIASHNAFHFE